MIVVGSGSQYLALFRKFAVTWSLEKFAIQQMLNRVVVKHSWNAGPVDFTIVERILYWSNVMFLLKSSLLLNSVISWQIDNNTFRVALRNWYNWAISCLIWGYEKTSIPQKRQHTQMDWGSSIILLWYARHTKRKKRVCLVFFKQIANELLPTWPVWRLHF